MEIRTDCPRRVAPVPILGKIDTNVKVPYKEEVGMTQTAFEP